MVETPLVSFVAQAVAGMSLGAGYQALHTRTQQRARTARHPEFLVVAGLIARTVGLAGLVALISRGTPSTVVGLLLGVALAWVAGRLAPAPRHGSAGMV